MRAILYENGTFWPTPVGREARSLLARGGRIERLDPDPSSIGDAARVDLEGRAVIPGPIDAHCHLVSYGMQRTREADLRGAASLAEIAARLREHAARLGIATGDGRWLLGRGFEQDRLVEGRFPSRADLDAVAADIPIKITRVCGHALAANTPALRAAGIDPAHRLEGFPEGVLTETAMAPVYRALPEPTSDDWRRAALHACEEAAAAGFVGVHSLMAHEREVRALLELAAEGPLPVRVVMQLPYSLLTHARGCGMRTGFGSDYLLIGAIKLFSDGSLGARTAALSAPYADDPGTSGELIDPPEDLARKVQDIYGSGFQACIHAIGDRAMEVTLDAIGMAELRRSELGKLREFPPRIEHASLVNPPIVKRMRDLGVAAAIQPQFAWSDYWAPERLGPERARGCYAFRTLAEAGIPLGGSTDCPVEVLSALAAIGSAVHRPDWSPGEALSLEETLRIFSEGAYALLGRLNGRLKQGDWADFTVLDADPRSIAPSDLRSLGVRMTVVGGEIVYTARPEAASPHSGG